MKERNFTPTSKMFSKFSVLSQSTNAHYGKALFAALLGTVAEWYDYSLYGYMSGVLSAYFFPSADPSVSLIRHFLVFAIGFIARPIGSYIFGSMGDEKGRKYALRWSIMGIALPTVIIGLLPSYQEWGLLSVVLLCLCRFTQGVFIAAEGDGVDIFIYESTSKKASCFANSLSWISSSIGIGIASFAAGLSLYSWLPIWFWRLPFVFAGVLGIVTFWLRRYLRESYDYSLYQDSNRQPEGVSFKGFLKVINANKALIFRALLLKGAGGGAYYFFFVFWPNYLSKILNVMSASEACFKATLLTVVSTVLAPVCGMVADRIGTLKAIKYATGISLFLTFLNGLFLYCFLNTPTWLLLATAVSIVFLDIPIYVTIMKLFRVDVRYRCMSFAHALASIIFSSTTPLIATFFWQFFKSAIAPLFYCVILLWIGLKTARSLKLPPEKLEASAKAEEDTALGLQV